MSDHNRMAGNCTRQHAKATDAEVCGVPECLAANPSTADDDLIQRARNLLNGMTDE